MTSKEYTFDYLVVEKAKAFLQYFTQHFNLRKPIRFTMLHLLVAHCMSLAAEDIS